MAEQVLFLLLGALPYIAIFLFLIISKKFVQFHLSDVFLGLFGIAISFGVGIVGALFIITTYPQTSSSVTNSFLTTVLAVTLGLALIAGEAYRFISLKPSKIQSSKTAFSGLAFGVGFSLGEFIFFVAIAIMNWGTVLSLDAALIVLADIVIQLSLSVAAYELIKQNNAASFVVGIPYYLTLFLSYALNGSVVLNIAQKVLILIISLVLLFTFFPKRNND